MNQEMKVSQDGTINFYQNRMINLLVIISSIMGILMLAFIFFFLKVLPDMETAYKVFGFMGVIELFIIIFFLMRFLRPKPILVINSQGFVKPFSLPLSQISTVVYEKADINAYLNTKISDLSKAPSSKYSSLVFKTKDEKIYKFPIDLLPTENKQILKDYLEKKGFTYQE